MSQHKSEDSAESGKDDESKKTTDKFVPLKKEQLGNISGGATATASPAPGDGQTTTVPPGDGITVAPE